MLDVLEPVTLSPLRKLYWPMLLLLGNGILMELSLGSTITFQAIKQVNLDITIFTLWLSLLHNNKEKSMDYKPLKL